MNKRAFTASDIRKGDKVVLWERVCVDGRPRIDVEATEVSDSGVWFGDTGISLNRLDEKYAVMQIQRGGAYYNTPGDLERIREVKRWPSVGDIYFCIDVQGGVVEATWEDDYNDRCRKQYGNIFRTADDAFTARNAIKKLLTGFNT